MNCINKFYNYGVQAGYSVVDDYKSVLYAEMDLFKLDPKKALFFLIALVTSIVLPIFGITLITSSPGLALFHIITSISLHSMTKVAIKTTPLRIEDYSINKVKNSDIVLFLEATDDHNDALSIGIIRRNIYKKHQIAIGKISNLSDLTSAIDEATTKQNNKIKALFIEAHGTPETFQLGKFDSDRAQNLSNKLKSATRIDRESLIKEGEEILSCVVTASNVHQLFSSFAKLEANAPIVLISCSTGGVPSSIEKKNIAQAISEVAPSRMVSAPIRDLSCMGTEVDPSSLKVRFFDAAFNKSIGGYAYVAARIWLSHLFGTNYGPDMTARYFSGERLPENA